MSHPAQITEEAQRNFATAEKNFAESIQKGRAATQVVLETCKQLKSANEDLTKTFKKFLEADEKELKEPFDKIDMKEELERCVRTQTNAIEENEFAVRQLFITQAQLRLNEAIRRKADQEFQKAKKEENDFNFEQYNQEQITQASVDEFNHTIQDTVDNLLKNGQSKKEVIAELKHQAKILEKTQQ